MKTWLTLLLAFNLGLHPALSLGSAASNTHEANKDAQVITPAPTTPEQANTPSSPTQETVTPASSSVTEPPATEGVAPGTASAPTTATEPAVSTPTEGTSPSSDATAPTAVAPERPVNLQGGPAVAAGHMKSQPCQQCHDRDGNSKAPNWPKIAGQYPAYLIKQLKDFRLGEKGSRDEPLMYSMTVNLTDQDIADLAAFYAAQAQTMGKAQENYVQLGERIYRGGNPQTGVTACLACHGPDGQGNEAAKFPRLAGQYAEYIEGQLRAFREGKRKNSPNGMMETISQRMSDQEIKAVSSYIEGLHNAKQAKNKDEKQSKEG